MEYELDAFGLGPCWDLILLGACQKRDIQAAFEALEHGADPDAFDFATGQSALAICCISGADSLVKELLCRGAHPDRADYNWATPLHHARLFGRDACARELLEAGADARLVDVYERVAADAEFIQSLFQPGTLEEASP